MSINGKILSAMLPEKFPWTEESIYDSVNNMILHKILHINSRKNGGILLFPYYFNKTQYIQHLTNKENCVFIKFQFNNSTFIFF